MPTRRRSAGARRALIAAFALAGAVTLGACGGGSHVRPGTVTLAQGSTTLPTRFEGTEIVVLATIDGKGPYPLLLDTGSQAGTLIPRVAREIGVRPRGRVTTRDAHHVRQSESTGRATITLGGFTARDVPFTIKDLPQSILDGHGIVGVLGYNAFAKSTLVLDYPNRRVEVTNARADASSPAATTLRATRDGTHPHAKLGFLMGHANLAMPWNMLIDTGSDLPMTLDRSAANIFADTANARALFASMSSSGSVRPVIMARLELDPLLGSTRVERVTAQVDSGNDSIGHPMLSHFKVTLDPVAGVVLFEHPEHAETITLPTWRGHGFTGKYQEGKGYSVEEVYDGMPAAIGGLREGDLITAIDGVSMIDHPERWPGLTDDATITQRVFTIEREGETRTLTLDLADILPEPK